MTLLDRAAQRLLDQLTLRARPKVASTDQGGQRSPVRGAGVEFAERRDYVPGDDARKIDWKAFARTRTLSVRTFEEERDLRVYVLVDVSSSMARGAPPKLETARRIAAAYGFLGLKQVERVTVLPFTDSVQRATPTLRRREDYPALDRFLAELSAQGVTTFRDAARSFVQRAPHRGYVVLVSDMMEATDWSPSLRLLAERGHQLCAVRVSCDEDTAPDFRGELELCDAETGDTLRVTVTEALLRAYRAELDAHAGRLRDAVVRAGGRYVEARAEQPFDEALRAVLRATLEAR